jgi:hypothetical protein
MGTGHNFQTTRSAALFVGLAILLMLTTCRSALGKSADYRPWWALQRCFDRADTDWAFPLVSVEKFGEDIVTNCAGYKTVDVEKGRLVPLLCEGLDQIYSICDDRKGGQYYLGSSAGKVLLRCKSQSGWSDIALPAAVEANPQLWKIAAGDGDIALAAADCWWFKHGSKWRCIEVLKDELYWCKLILKKGKLYAASDRDPWSGCLFEFDGKTGKRKLIYCDDYGAVTDLKLAPDGKLYFVCGSCHVYTGAGSLHYYDGTVHDISTIAGVRRNCGLLYSGEWFPRLAHNWPLEPTCFAGLGLEKDGSIVVASDEYGLLRYAKKHWTILTKDWPEKASIPICGLEQTAAGTVVIPVNYRGVILYDQKTGAYRFILPGCSFPASSYLQRL